MKRSFPQQTTQSVSGTSKKARAKKRQSTDPAVPRPVNSWGRFNQVGFPNKLLMRHRYVESGSLTSTTGGLALQNFRANGMFDPNQTGVGHQPMYFDTLTGIYDHYTVISSVITVEFTPASSTTLPAIVGLMLNDDSTTTPGSSYAIAEQGGSVSKVLSATGNVNPIVLKSKFSAKGTFGGSVLANDNLQGTASADPTEQTIFTLFAQTLDLAGTTSTYWRVTIDYLAVWDELKDLAIQ